jgi:hypothetical protein
MAAQYLSANDYGRQAIMAVLQKLLVDSWTSETEKAWTELWDLSATAMMKVCPLDTKAGTVSGILHEFVR